MAKGLHTEDFASSKDILDFKPNIVFVEPEQIIEEPPLESKVQSLDDVKNETDEIIAQYNDIEQQSKDMLDIIDQLSKDLVINLDPDADAHIIDALQRHTGDPTMTRIPYSLYKDCLADINKLSIANLNTVNPEDILKAKNEPFRSNFGGLDLPSGLKRPELEKANQSIKPINLKKFKANQLLLLFKALVPMITKLAGVLIKKALKPW